MTYPIDRQSFNRAASETLTRSLAVSNERGGQYADSWHLDNQVTTFLDHVLALNGIVSADREWKRLVLVAAMIDIKDSRMGGEWKADSVDDSINYRAAFSTWRSEYDVHPREREGSR